MLPSENAELALAFFEWRQEAAAGKDAPDLSDPAWYKNIAGFSAMNLDKNLITTASDIFRITSAAKMNDFALATTAVVQRLKSKKTGKWYCKILSWQSN
jgi:cobyrinic acid a,c-diamide synthase